MAATLARWNLPPLQSAVEACPSIIDAIYFMVLQKLCLILLLLPVYVVRYGCILPCNHLSVWVPALIERLSKDMYAVTMCMYSP